MKRFIGGACSVLVACLPASAINAQEVEGEEETAPAEEAAQPVEVAPPAEECAPPEPREITLAKMTPVYFRIDAALGSKTSTSGETFPITVTEPVMLDDVEIIPVGTTGMGEVIHAKKAGASGSGGELVLTANYIDLGEQRIPLRSMQLGLTGKDQMDLAMATGVFAGPIGFLVRGKNINVAEGALAGAKLAQDTVILLEPAGDAEKSVCAEGTENEI